MKLVELDPNKSKSEFLSKAVEKFLETWNSGDLEDVIIIAGTKDGTSFMTTSMCETELIANLEVAKTHVIVSPS